MLLNSLLPFSSEPSFHNIVQLEVQVDADYKLQDMKKVYKELEHKGKGYEKKLCDLDTALSKHMEQ